MTIDPWILAFSAATVLATIWMGFWSARRSKTAHDFYVAGRSVSVGWNASAISGEYLSAASFMGVAGMVMSSGYDALWYPVCYACGYLFLLLFIAGPLRRFGAYTIPDFAEGRFDSPVFRKIAVVFVLFIGFFYTMPQMKGAGTTLAYIFPGLPYWAGVVLVGAVITLNVALGGMKGITLVQAFQYWAKMFAISVPIFVLMAVYGHYGEQLGVNGSPVGSSSGKTMQTTDRTWIELSGSTNLVAFSTSMSQPAVNGWVTLESPRILPRMEARLKAFFGQGQHYAVGNAKLVSVLLEYTELSGRTVIAHTNLGLTRMLGPLELNWNDWKNTLASIEQFLRTNGIVLRDQSLSTIRAMTPEQAALWDQQVSKTFRQALPEKAPADSTWLSPFGPLTTKAAKAAAAAKTKPETISVRPDLPPEHRITVNLDTLSVTQALVIYADITGRQLWPRTNGVAERLDEMLGGRLSRMKIVKRSPEPDSGVRVHSDGSQRPIEVKEGVEEFFKTNGLALVPEGHRYFRIVEVPSSSAAALSAQKAWLAKHEKPLALLYTYSLIIALVCGTAGLPHILVRFYTNPDGVAAKRTTMWVMILIGVFYLFPPVFGVMGRNLLPELYAATGAKGTDKVVLELPRILNVSGSATVPVVLSGVSPDSPGAEEVSARTPKPAGETPALPIKKKIPWGSILSGITCAGAFAAFMSTFSGLLVSMTGALAHDVYGRMLNPKSTPEQRLRAFKIAAVVIGGVAILLGMQVEPLQINFMVGQAFAIAAASYFPLLFVSCWWRRLTMRGAATGMLTGGVAAVTAVTLTNFSDLGWFKLAEFWAENPLLRILCEQPAIWTVPLAIGLMIVISKLTAQQIPSDIRLKMLVLHAPEKLGLKQEYIQEHQAH